LWEINSPTHVASRKGCQCPTIRCLGLIRHCVCFSSPLTLYTSILKVQITNAKILEGIPTSKIQRKKMRMIKNQHKKWTIAHQMWTHYNLIGGTSNPTNKKIVIDSHTKDASKNEKKKLVKESLKGLTFPSL
jgi:hypothetical protein